MHGHYFICCGSEGEQRNVACWVWCQTEQFDVVSVTLTVILTDVVIAVGVITGAAIAVIVAIQRRIDGIARHAVHVNRVREGRAVAAAIRQGILTLDTPRQAAVDVREDITGSHNVRTFECTDVVEPAAVAVVGVLVVRSFTDLESEESIRWLMRQGQLRPGVITPT